ncbi:MAG: cation diffusion facilitator family transporter [Bacteroidia bacterium]
MDSDHQYSAHQQEHKHDHEHHHGHEHPDSEEGGHHNHHHHIPKRITQAFRVGIILNSVFVVVEVVAGLFTHSLALLTDAGHNLSDVASLALAWMAARFALKKSNPAYTFGYKQSTVLVALLNAGILLLALGAIAYEAIIRIQDARPVEGKSVVLVAAIGIVINAMTALLFMRDKASDLNLKGAYLHMASDALVSLGVVIGGIVMVYTGWYWLDSVLSLLIVLVIVYGTWDLLRESLRLSLNGVPRNVNMKKLHQFLSTRPGVKDAHDLHVWALSTTENALTVHLVMPDGLPDDAFYTDLRLELQEHHHIEHSTIQVERGDEAFQCAQKC